MLDPAIISPSPCTTRTDLAARSPLPVPIVLFLETKDGCTFDCRMCARHLPGFPGTGQLSIDAIGRLLRSASRDYPVPLVRMFFFSEPLIDRRLPIILDCIRHRHAQQVHVYSNGSLLTEQISEALLRTRMDYLRVSIYGTSNERQQHITRSKTTADAIYRNCQTFRQARDRINPYCQFGVKLLASTAEEIDEFRRLYHDVADCLVIEPVCNFNGVLDVAGVKEFSPVDRVHPVREVCPFPFYNAIVASNGDVLACCVDWNHGTRLGNIHHEPFYDIWNGDRMRQFRLMHLKRRRWENLSCRRCKMRHADNLDDVPPERFADITKPRNRP